MKVLLLLLLPSFALATKGDVSAPPKISAAPTKAEQKRTPDTNKRTLHLDFKKSS